MVKSTINITYDDRAERFEVTSTANTTKYLPGDMLSRREVDDLIASAKVHNRTVNIKKK